MAKAKHELIKTRVSTQPVKGPAPRFVDPETLPDRYIVTIDGVCMEPILPNGAKVICCKDEKIQSGDLGVFYFRPERTPFGEHQAQCKRLVLGVPPFVKFPWRNNPESNVDPIVAVEMLNPRRQFIYGCSDLLAIHKCLGPVPADAVYDAETNSYHFPSSAAGTEEQKRKPEKARSVSDPLPVGFRRGRAA